MPLGQMSEFHLYIGSGFASLGFGSSSFSKACSMEQSGQAISETTQYTRACSVGIIISDAQFLPAFSSMQVPTMAG
jgi:hypothetical protein